jgi:hypothetical protein
MRKWILSALLVAFAAVAWALPTLPEVEAEVQAGRYAQAETMMREVVDAKPGSARAHYVYAEILAHQGKVALAAEEAQKARVIDPDVKFTDPEKFRSFEAALLQAQRPATRQPQDARRAQGAAAAAPAQPSPGIPSWIWLVGVVVVGVLLWRGFSRSRDAAIASSSGYAGGVPGQPGVPGPYGAGGYAPGAVPPGYPPQRSSMLGTGLAAAGGVAAGMLASELLHRRGEHNADETNAGPGTFDSPDAGRSALEDRPIDFGSGGNDWDAGGGDVGGGGGGSDGGWD